VKKEMVEKLATSLEIIRMSKILVSVPFKAWKLQEDLMA